MRSSKPIIGSVAGAMMLLGGLGGTAAASSAEDPGAPFETKVVPVAVCEPDLEFGPNSTGFSTSGEAVDDAGPTGAPRVELNDPCP